MTDDVGYYQILDNYTIWRLETIADSNRHRPLRILSLPSRSPEVQSSIHSSYDVPLHKKRNLAKNLRAMINELQIKVDKIEAEINDDDIVTSMISQIPKITRKEEGHSVQGRCNGTVCPHSNELATTRKQLEILNQTKNSLEEQIVRLQLDKSANQGTDSEKRVTKLETENKLLKEQVKLSLEKLSLLNKEKCQDFWGKFGKSAEFGPSALRELQFKKSRMIAMNLKQDLKSLKESFQVFMDSGFHQLQKMKQFVTNKNALEINENKLRPRSVPDGNRHISHYKPQPLSNGGYENKVHEQHQSDRRMDRKASLMKGSIKDETWNRTANKDSDAESDFTWNVERTEKKPGGRGNDVLYKIRPLPEKGCKSSLNFSKNEIQIQHRSRTKTFQCDHVIHSQEQLFETLKPAVLSCLEGINVCIFLYGETGSGKTFTAEGSVDQEGILSLCIGEILKIMKIKNESIKLSCGVAELRNENFKDILNPESSYLETRQTSDGSIILSNWTQTAITSKEDYDRIITRCQEVHKVHNCNMSHLIHALHIYLPGRSVPVKLCIIDLAGSERLNKPSQDPFKIKEIQNISKSLTCLGDVLHATNARMCHVPFRSSKLTHFLQDYMKGKNICRLIVHLRADEKSSSENISSLMFGQRTVGSDVIQGGLKTPTKVSSRAESQSSTPRPRRPSTANVLPEIRAFTRRSSISSERSSVKKLSITHQTEGKY